MINISSTDENNNTVSPEKNEREDFTSKQCVEKQKKREDEIKKFKSEVLICNDANNENKKRLLSRNVDTENMNGSAFKDVSTSENKLIKINEDNIVLKKINEMKENKKTVENGPSTTRTCKDDKVRAMTDDKRKKNSGDDKTDTVPDIFMNTVRRSYVQNNDSSRIEDTNKNDVHTEALPKESQVKVVRNEKMKVQQE